MKKSCDNCANKGVEFACLNCATVDKSFQKWERKKRQPNPTKDLELKNEKPATIENYVIIVKLTNGKYHQVFMSNEFAELVIQFVQKNMPNETIKVMEQEINGISF